MSLLFLELYIHACSTIIHTRKSAGGPLGRKFAKFAQLILTITITDRGFSPLLIDSLLVKAARQETE